MLRARGSRCVPTGPLLSPTASTVSFLTHKHTSAKPSRSPQNVLSLHPKCSWAQPQPASPPKLSLSQ